VLEAPAGRRETPLTAGRATAGRRDRQFALALAVIAGVGLVWRVAYVLWMRHDAVTGDGPYYHFGALNIVDGHPFVNFLTRLIQGIDVPDAARPPGWTLVLAGPSALGMRSWLSHQLLACVVGGATIVMTGLAARTAFGRRVGIVAATLAAVYPNVWLYERELQTETLALLASATTLWLAYRYRAAPGLARAVMLGASVGVLTMSRAELITIVVFLLVPLVLATGGVEWRRRLTWLAAAGAACAVVIAPWTVYNADRFERPVLLTTNAGSTMLQGNCAQTYHGETLGYFRLGCAFSRAKEFSPDPSVNDGQQRRAAIDYMRDNASRVPVVLAARVGRTFGLYRPFQQMHFDADRQTELWVIRTGFVMNWLLLPLAIAGAVLAHRRRIPVYPLLAFPAAVLVSVLLTFGQTRYRAPAEISIIVLAAVAIGALLTPLWSRLEASPAGAPAPPEAAATSQT
jgi:4-amino-4-deoxy-L-arabinose transferase-like glycosyltransferase